MANTFKNYATAGVGTSPSTILTASANTTVIGYSIANVTSNTITASVIVTVSGTDCYLIKDAVVPAGGALVPVGGDQKLVLETGDAIKVSANTNASADVIMSVLEIT
jgi:hypothetical protein